MSKLIPFCLSLFFLCGCNRSNTYHIVFNSVEGITTKSEVLSNGVEVGAVKDMHLLPDNNILVEVEMNNKLSIPNDSRFTIEHSFFAASIGFEAGSSSVYLSPNDTIRGNNKPSKGVETVNEVGRSVESIFHAADKQDSIIQRLDRLENKIDALYKALGKPNSAN